MQLQAQRQRMRQRRWVGLPVTGVITLPSLLMSMPFPVRESTHKGPTRASQNLSYQLVEIPGWERQLRLYKWYAAGSLVRSFLGANRASTYDSNISL